MENFYKNLNRLVETLQITGTKATSLQKQYESLTEDQKQFLEKDILVFRSASDLDRYFGKIGVTESTSSYINDKKEVTFEEEVTLNLHSLNSSIGVIKGILVFFLVLWILGFLVGLFFIFGS